jgi:hypothetical protein
VTVHIGTPITTEQATRAVLRLLNTPMVGDVDLDSSPGYTIQRIQEKSYHLLSTGEQRLVDIAWAIWSAGQHGANLGVLGGIDHTNRRKVLMVLWYLYLGRDVPIVEYDTDQFVEAFGG